MHTSDVIIVNTGTGRHDTEPDDCLCRVERLLDRVKGLSGRKSELCKCDPRDLNGKSSRRLCDILKPMCAVSSPS